VGAYGLAAGAWSPGMTLAQYENEARIVAQVVRMGEPQVLRTDRRRYRGRDPGG